MPLRDMAIGAIGGALLGMAGAALWPRLTAAPKRLPPAPIRAKNSSDLVKGGVDVYVRRDALEDVISRCLTAAGATAPHARLVAKVLVAADCRGIPSHGVNRAEFYCQELKAGLIDGTAKPKVYREGPSFAVIDGCNALGAVASQFAMTVAIRKARETGVAIVCVHHSNHYGIAGYWANLALEEKLIGFSFTNTSPFMVPTRAKSRNVGTNPIACYCPAQTDSFQLDMATTTVPVGKVEVCHRKRQAIPLGWGVDKQGAATTDPEAVFDEGGLTPLGGMEETAGYKGYGLAMLVEILTAVLPGDAAVGPDVQPWTCNRSEALNYGHCFIVIDPTRFCGDAFESRLLHYLERMRSLQPGDGQPPVLVPGDPEKAEEREARTRGVRLNESVAASVKFLAARLGVEQVPEEFASLNVDGVVLHTGIQQKS